MTNSRASRGLTLLHHYLATGTAATETFTKTLDMKNTYRELTIIITGKSTAALTLQLKISAATDYNLAWIGLDTTTVSGAVVDANATIDLLGIGHIDGAEPFYSRAIISLNDANDFMQVLSQSFSSHEGMQIFGSEVQTASTDITSIEVKTSTSTWIAGTEISIYGLTR